MTKEEIILKLKEQGYEYKPLFWPDGSVMTHKFVIIDTRDPECSWTVSIEDHHDELPNVDDWLIYCSYHNPEEKDWFGHQIDTQGAVEYKAMKLIIEFVDILDKERSNGC